jgi:hypothetical protein
MAVITTLLYLPAELSKAARSALYPSGCTLCSFPIQEYALVLDVSSHALACLYSS